MDIILHLILGFFATLGFAVYFNVPLGAIFSTCLTGAIGWVVSYIFTVYLDEKILGTFLASFVIGLLSDFFAVKIKKPTTVFIIPGITPLVPGAGTYYTMLYLVQENYLKAITKGAETLFIAAAIAIGIIFAAVSVDFLKSFKKISKQNI